MIVSFEDEASETIDDIIDFIDSINTPGSGRFWLINFLQFIGSYAKPNVKYALCNHRVYAEYGFSCITYNGWVVAFEIKNDELIVHYIVRGDTLT